MRFYLAIVGVLFWAVNMSEAVGVSLVSMATFEVVLLVQHPLLWFEGVVSLTNRSLTPR